MRYFLLSLLIMSLVLIPGNAMAAININSASFSELDSLPGVGEVTANKVLEYRSATGAFSNIAEVCALVGTNGVSVETATCQNIAAAITFGPLGEPSAAANDEDEEDEEATISTTTTGDTGGQNKKTPPKPVPGLALTIPSTVYTGQLAEFDAEPTDGTDGRLVRYSWNFGDGHTSSEKNPRHQYLRPGTYVVVVESYYNKETKEARREVVVVPLNLKVTPALGGVEIANEGGIEIDLGGITVSGTGEFTFPPNTILLSGQSLVVEGVSGQVHLKDQSGQYLAFTSSSAEMVPASSARRVSSGTTAKSATAAPATEVVNSESEISELGQINTAAVANTEVPPRVWPYLGLLAVIAFSFLALFKIKPF